MLFRRLAAFSGGFDLTAARAVAGDGELERFQVLDQLTLLVDKSLLVVENRPAGTRYVLPETVRQYALEKLGESGEADAVRTRHRDHYTELAIALDEPVTGDVRPHLQRTEGELDNLRAAFAWSHEHGDAEVALALASALQPIWRGGSRGREGLAWFAAALDGTAGSPDVSAAVRARALSDEAVLDASTGNSGNFARAEEALALARDVDDPVLLSRALAACLFTAGRDAAMTQRYLPEALAVARAVGEPRRLADVLARQAYAAFMVDGDPTSTRLAAEEGLALADAIDDRANSRSFRWCLAAAQWMEGDLEGAVQRLDAVIPDAIADGDVVVTRLSVCTRSNVLSYLGHPDAARAASEEALRTAGDLGEIFEGLAQNGIAFAALAAGDADAAHVASQASWFTGFRRESVAGYTVAEAALAVGEVDLARELTDEALSFMAGFHRKLALTVAARVAMVHHRHDVAEQHLHDAIAICSQTRSLQGLPDLFECLAQVAVASTSWAEGTRLLGAAAALRQRTMEVRFRVHDAAFDAAEEALHKALGDEQFDELHQEGFALTPDEAVAYARRGRGERKRPPSGWAALTPAERDVVKLLSDGLANKQIATRLFISPRTVQTHLTHVYAKLGLASRVQLAQEAARHPDS
jgi:DNA-binding CsgD family transcriptional regulator